MSTLILRSADDTTVKESIAKEEEEEELDRKAKDDEEELKRKEEEEEEEEYRKKMLMVKFNESKLMHARSKRAIQIKRHEDQFYEIMMAELHQENIESAGRLMEQEMKSIEEDMKRFMEKEAKEEEEELDRKAKDDEEELKRKEEEEEEYRKKMLMVKFNESKLMHARSKRAIQMKRHEDQFFEIMMAELHQEDIQANVNEMKRFMWELEEIEREAKGKRQAQKQRTS